MKQALTIILITTVFSLTAQVYESGVKNYLNLLNVPDSTLSSGYQLEVHARRYFRQEHLSYFVTAGIGYFQWVDKRTFQSKRNSTLLLQAGLHDNDMIYGYASATYLWHQKAMAVASNIEIRPFPKFLESMNLTFTGQIGLIKELKETSSPTGFLSLGIGISTFL